MAVTQEDFDVGALGKTRTALINASQLSIVTMGFTGICRME